MEHSNANTAYNRAISISNVIKETLSTLGDVKQFDESHIASAVDNKYACEIRVVSPPQGKDPDEFIRTMGGDVFKEYIKNAPLLIDFLLNNILLIVKYR